MPIRHIEIPAPIKLRSPTGESIETVTFQDIARRLLNHPSFIQSYEMIRSAAAITRALEGEHSPLELAEEDWKHLKTAAESPQQVTPTGVVAGLGYMPWVLVQILPYLSAIVDAKEAVGNGAAKATAQANEAPAA